MHRRRLMITVLSATLIFVAGACKQKQEVSTEDVLEQAEKTVQMSEQLIDGERSQFMMKVGKRMNELRREIVLMQKKYESMNNLCTGWQVFRKKRAAGTGTAAHFERGPAYLSPWLL